tara:strand:+ start:4655 stop:5299 length:645 start_codon:yes stop_codon:yes gene_type:complete
MSTIKIRNLPLATNEQVKPGNFLACALDTDSGLQKLTRKLTLNQVVSGGLQDGTVPIPTASLPIATTTSLGVVQIGANLNITPEGILSANNPTSPYQLPIASTTVLGGIKVGANLTIDADGTLNAPASSGGGGTFYAFTSGIITNEGQHTITYPAGWTSGTPDNIIVSTRYPTGAASTVHFQLVGFTASTVTVFAQAGSATFATHFCDVLLVKN